MKYQRIQGPKANGSDVEGTHSTAESKQRTEWGSLRGRAIQTQAKSQLSPKPPKAEPQISPLQKSSRRKGSFIVAIWQVRKTKSVKLGG